MEAVVGIDLSGVTSSSRGRTVGVQVFLETPRRLGDRLVVPRRLKGDRVLVEWIEESRSRVIAIDLGRTDADRQSGVCM